MGVGESEEKFEHVVDTNVCAGVIHPWPPTVCFGY